jgi:hypothetical protein
MHTDEDEVRIRFAGLMREVANGTLTARDAIAAVDSWSTWPRHDRLSNDGYHSLHHYDADADIRAKDLSYAASQREGLRRTADRLEAAARRR